MSVYAESALEQF